MSEQAIPTRFSPVELTLMFLYENLASEGHQGQQLAKDAKKALLALGPESRYFNGCTIILNQASESQQ